MAPKINLNILKLLFMKGKKGVFYMDPREILKKYFNNCFAKNLSKKTIDNYSHTLNCLINYLDSRGMDNFKLVDSDVISSFLKSRGEKVSKTTIRNNFVALRAFFNFMAMKGYITDNPFRYLSTPKIPKRKKIIFKNSEIQKLMQFDTNTFLGSRNYCIMAFLFSTGMRISELTSLRLDDIDLELELINIIGKGDKQRYVPISSPLKNLIIRYFKKRNSYVTEHNLRSRYFFISRSGRMMCPTNVQDIFRKVKKQYGIDKKRFSPHTFRHTFATDYLLNGGDVFSLQKILGHSNLNTTKEYVDMDDNLIRMQNEKYNPFSNKKWVYTE